MNVGGSPSNMDEREKWLNDVIINKRTRRGNASGNWFTDIVHQCVENFVCNLKISPVMSMLLILIPVGMGLSIIWLQNITMMGILYLALFFIAMCGSFSALFFDKVRAVEIAFYAFGSYVACAICDISFYLPK